MVTDRCTTAGEFFAPNHIHSFIYARRNNKILTLGPFPLGLLLILSNVYSSPLMKMSFVSLFFLDISSHWMQMTSSLMLGSHHKSAEGNATRFFLVRWFYTNYLFFGWCCVGAEFTYVLLYVLKYYTSPTPLHQVLALALNYVMLPACAIKNVVNVFQLTSASYAIAEADVKEWNRVNKAK